METTTKARARRADSNAPEPSNDAKARMAHARALRTYEADAPLHAISNIERPVTTSQLAEHLQVSERTIATWRLSGLIPYWRINARSFRYRISTVEKALENLR